MMNWRYKLADWIVGGELTQYEKAGWEGWQVATYYMDALQDIAEMETPGAAPAARRMANRAREALK